MYSSPQLANFTLEQSFFSALECLQDSDCIFIAFDKAVFGTVELQLNSENGGEIVRVHLGEARKSNRIDREPGATIRYREAEPITLKKGDHKYRAIIPPNARNTETQAIHLPLEIGEVLPFRFVEIEGYENSLTCSDVRQIMVHYPFDDSASQFESSSVVLNKIWDMCKHTIKATSFAGIYVDGDRERIPYEGDAYINQLSHYAVDTHYELDRRSHEYFLEKPTWPTEWILHSNLMAWADYMQTADISSIRHYYSLLQEKSLMRLARHDGLISTKDEAASEDKGVYRKVNLKQNMKDLVDWPPASFSNGLYGENDDYDMSVHYNTVVNAFYYQNLKLLSKMAAALGEIKDSENFQAKALNVYEIFNKTFFDPCFGVYLDGENSEHSSLHANMIPLAFGLVPKDRQQKVIDFIKSKGMACSVYGAQYLLEGLYKAGEAQYALGLMEAKHDRSWWNMMAIGSTMALEAWDKKYKGNLDWNHAWGTAPLNIIPRYLFGIKPLTPGFQEISIKPQPGMLQHASITYPTPKGSMTISFEVMKNSRDYSIKLPKGITAHFNEGQIYCVLDENKCHSISVPL